MSSVGQQRGVSAYVGAGENIWPAVHRLDAARLFRLALERGAGNEAYHAVAECLPFRRIAEAIGRQAGLPVKSLTPDEAERHFGPMAMWATGNGPASSETTRALLGWTPREPGIIEDIERPDYSG
jgi:nucleoside-diphosphate-sugar epimerase